MNESLEHMLEQHHIRRVLERWCTGVDRCDAALMNSTYWPDGTDDHGRWKGLGHDFSTFVIPVLKQHYTSTLHMLGQSYVRLFGAAAASETYCVAYHRIERGDAVDIEVAHGRYVDHLEKRDGEWRIRHRDCVMESYFTHKDVDTSAADMGSFSRGDRAGNDSFQRLTRELAGQG